jgi:homoprotocatechuate degradation regulator HpaR
LNTLNPTHRNLPLLLLHVREAAMGHFRPILKHFGLTDQQWRILRALSESGDDLEPGQIAEACKIQKPSLTGIIARMVEMKWIGRHASTVDQRRLIISLAPKGRTLVDRIAPLVDRQYLLIEESVGVDTFDAIYRSLDDALGLLSREIGSVMADPAAPDARMVRAAASKRTRTDARKAVR